jgi:putative ABC transport system permease protein
VLASEPLAYRRGLGPGAAIRLRTDRGEREFRVAGVFRDYGSAAGVVAMSRATYDAHWDDRAISGLALEAVPGQDVDALVAALRDGTGGQEAVIRSSRALREASLAIFDRTFAITGVLRLAIVLVAFIGVLSALLAWQLERAREVGVLRALGCSPAEIGRMVLTQTGLMGLLAGALALPVGVALAAALIFVINRRSFGWTMPLDVSPAVLAEGLALAVGAALLAGLYPARRMARASPAEALREE